MGFLDDPYEIISEKNRVIKTLNIELAAYRALGTVEELSDAKAETDRLWEIVLNIPLDRIEEICTAERDGRCVVLPCKVGDTVYYNSFGKTYKGICHAITIHKNSVQVHLYDYDGDNASISAKNVFLTPEKAEAALKEGN